MSIIGEIGHFFSNIGHRVKVGFIALFGEDFGQKLADAAEEFGKQELGKVAITVVKGLENAALSGPEKRDEAFKAIGQSLVAQGKSLPDSTIYFAIEFALQALRGGVNSPAPLQAAE